MSLKQHAVIPDLAIVLYVHACPWVSAVYSHIQQYTHAHDQLSSEWLLWQLASAGHLYFCSLAKMYPCIIPVVYMVLDGSNCQILAKQVPIAEDIVRKLGKLMDDPWNGTSRSGVDPGITKEVGVAHHWDW